MVVVGLATCGSKEEAEKVKGELEGAGASVELK